MVGTSKQRNRWICPLQGNTDKSSNASRIKFKRILISCFDQKQTFLFVFLCWSILDLFVIVPHVQSSSSIRVLQMVHVLRVVHNYKWLNGSFCLPNEKKRRLCLFNFFVILKFFSRWLGHSENKISCCWWWSFLFLRCYLHVLLLNAQITIWFVCVTNK